MLQTDYKQRKWIDARGALCMGNGIAARIKQGKPARLLQLRDGGRTTDRNRTKEVVDTHVDDSPDYAKQLQHCNLP